MGCRFWVVSDQYKGSAHVFFFLKKKLIAPPAESHSAVSKTWHFLVGKIELIDRRCCVVNRAWGGTCKRPQMEDEEVQNGLEAQSNILCCRMGGFWRVALRVSRSSGLAVVADFGVW